MNRKHFEKELNEKLATLKEDCDDFKKVKADLYGVTLRSASLAEVGQKYADLKGSIK